MRVRTFARAGLLIALASAGLSAQAPAARRPAATAAAPRATQITSVEGITEYSLPNGLRVLLFPDQSKPTVTVNITYLVGSKHEGYGETGMAHLLEHLVFKGTPKHPKIDEEFQKWGARPNGTTFYDRTNYFETIPASDSGLAWALDLEADRMINSYIAKKDLESEFSVVRNELEAGENDQFRVLWQRVARTAYQWHGYGRNTIGSRSDIEGVPIERLQMFYRRYYQPDNAVLLVAGKFDPDRTLRLIEQKFGRIPKPRRTLEAGNLLFASYTVEPPQDGERHVNVRRVGSSQMLMMAHHVPSAVHADAPAVDVLEELLTDEPSGRFYKALVDSKLATGVFRIRDLLLMRDPSLSYAIAVLREDQSLDSARAALERATDAARTGTFTADEVDRAKNSLSRNIALELNNSESIGYTLSEWIAMGDWRMYFMHRDRVAKVTPDDVKRVAAAYLKPQNRTTGYFIATKSPDRSEIPNAPSIASILAGYKGGAVVQAGEAFEATPRNIEARIQRSALPSGMQLTLLPKATRGAKVNAQITLRHGTEQSLTGKGQVPSFASAMLDRGTATLTRQQYVDSLAKLKAQVFIGGAGNNAVANIETTRPNLIAVLDLVAQALKTPRYDAEELEKLKKENLAAIEQARTQPNYLASIAFQRKVMPKPKGHPLYVATAEETIADINEVTVAAIREFHRANFGASHADLAVVGDFDPAEVKAAAAKHFGDWRSPAPFARLVRTYAKTDSSFESIETPDRPQAMFIAGSTVKLSDADPDYPAMYLANYMFGGSGMASKIFDRLRQKEGISYGAGSGLQVQSLDQYGIWLTQAIYAPQNAERLQRAFREELDKALKEGFTAEEVEKNKAGYLQARSQGRANDNELIGTLVSRRFAGRTMAWDEAYEKAVMALTAEQVNAAMRKYIDPKNVFIVRAGDFAKNPAPKPTP
ncbi:MAG TPA: pitrilysin family protein [Gemmatimonadaceae bacterium]|nr:pitrilysin family protein [Gemmatimonadaceae bacterium]